MKRLDVCALGELLIDFTQSGTSGQGNDLFEANPGGAPCNVLAMLTKLGHTTGFMGKVGDDMFGAQLRTRVSGLGIDTQCLLTDKDVRTTLAFVQTFANGDRDFSFYRNPGADMMLCAEEVDTDYAANTRVFHFGTLSMTHDTVREATQKAVLAAKAGGAVISFDPNVRPPLWEDMEHCREQVLWGLGQCDMMKISDNEITWLTGEADYAVGARWILTQYPNVRLLLVSLGAQGSMAFCGGAFAQVAAFSVNTIETTGAGDTFGACCIHAVLTHGLDGLVDEARLRDMLTFAGAAAAIVTTRKGALCVMPGEDEVRALMAQA